jgi:predicted Fe-Mo cluster-binding NifX family protein
MLAIPIDKKDSTTLSKLYGRAPFFALLDTEIGNFTVVENEAMGKGPKSAEFLKEKGACATIYYHMGEGVYKGFEKNGMEVYCANYCTDSLDLIYQNFKNGLYTKLNSDNFEKFLDPGEGETCKCGCEG